MNWPVRRSVLGLTCAVALSLGVARAQPVTGRDDAEVRTRRTANLSGADQLRESTTIVESISTTRRQVSDLLDRARQDRDIIKTNCLNDRLTQVDVTLRSAREHQELLQNAVSLNNDGQRNHEFQLMSILRSRSDTLRGEAQQCVGEEAGNFDRGTVVVVQVDPSIPESDTTNLTPDNLAPDRPLVTSPVL
ncbi:MAG: hypothetical protein R3A52_10245 [Polyangiales bacterium]